MNSTETPAHPRALLHIRLGWVELVRLFAKHGPGWMFSALLLLCITAIVLAAFIYASLAARAQSLATAVASNRTQPAQEAMLGDSYAVDFLAGGGGLSLDHKANQGRGYSALVQPAEPLAKHK